MGAACTPSVGDECQSSVDCSVNGDRVCDLSFPGGYCTVFGCDQDTCPDEAVCVEFRFLTPRLAETSCMARCESNDDCRDGYDCAAAEVLEENGENLAQVLDSSPRAFCIPPDR